ncbi:MAG: GNAT family N-acetyltransferase [Gammaproteobacteria bacterium]|nr:GNAT family N-acetyltransferase [Gammaproteobacteria bacterium]
MKHWITQRLIIRPFQPTDADFVVQLLNDESFLRYIGDKQVRTKQDALEYLENGPLASYKLNGFGLNLVSLKKDSTPIGMCGLVKRQELEQPDLGFAFLPDYCGKGYAYESAMQILSSMKKDLDLNSLLAVTLPNNLRSNQLLMKLNFKLIGSMELYDTMNNLYQYKI